jgi:hypothetical protein
MQEQMQFSSTTGYLNVKGKHFVLLCLVLILSFPLRATAQEQKLPTIQPDELGFFKLKLTRSLNSGKIRVGDYVQFQLVEDVMYTPRGRTSEKFINKETPVWGLVVDREHRFTALKKGKFGIGKLWTRTTYGQQIYLDIMRPELPSDLCVNKIPQKALEAERKAAKRNKKSNVELKAQIQAQLDARIKALEEEARLAKPVPCVQGRVYAGTFISSLPSALLSVGTATILAGFKDDATNAVIGVTLADKIVTQSGLSNIINGVDAEMEKDEIFDARLSEEITLLPRETPTTAGIERVGRFTAPTPPGYLVTNYFSDLVKYPSEPGQPAVYTGKVIERYTDKPSGSKMNMCETQDPPAGWVVIDRGVDPVICPREPGATANGPNYSVILKTPLTATSEKP